jgi:hydroxymethylpyrimidine/phosphomethylpyrimidine kinase
MTAITAITAQNTVGVWEVQMVRPEIVLAQVRAVVADIGVDAVKVGMLGTAEVTHAVARALDELPPGTPVVVDPVMVAESGARLLQPDAQRALVEEILPRATVLTPNLPEAEVLAGWRSGQGAGTGDEGAERENEGAGLSTGAGVEDPEMGRLSTDAGVEDPEMGRLSTDAGVEDPEMGRQPTDAEVEALARAVLALGPRTVVLTGGHRARAVDLFVDSEGDGGAVEIPGVRHRDGAAHGSGCTHSSVLAAQLALGRTPLQAARAARALAGDAVAHGLRDIGAGAGPVNILSSEGPRGAIIDRR